MLFCALPYSTFVVSLDSALAIFGADVVIHLARVLTVPLLEL